MFAYLGWARRAGQAGFLAALALGAFGCGLGAEADTPDDSRGGAGGTVGGGGGAGAPAPMLALQINDSTGTRYTPRNDETVERDPRETTEVWAFALDGPHTVRFALLPNDQMVTSGDTVPGDAALDKTEETTDADGLAQVLLTAPSRPTTFLLRASIGTLATTQLRFTVKGTDDPTLLVYPLYNGGRSVERWTATAYKQKTCQEVLENPPDGDLYEARSENPEDPVRLEGVPVGVPLAVTLRAEHFARGCADLLLPDQGSVEQRVDIEVTDVPIQLEESELELELGLDTTEGWVTTLEEPLPAVALALRGESEDDVEALLDAMEAAATVSDFGATRESENWDTRVREALGTGSSDVLRQPFERWLWSGLDGLSGEGAFQGRLGPSAGSAELVLDSVFGLVPEDAGFTVVTLGSWSVSADVALIAMNLEFRPSAFLVAAARAPARDEVSGADSIAEALGELLPCSLVATALADSEKCGNSCEKLCVAGLSKLVEAAAAPRELALLKTAATGAVGVGPNAELASLDGSWIGKLEYAGSEIDVGGSASATSD